MYAAYGTLMLLYVMIGSTILSMGLWLLSYNIMWMFMVVNSCYQECLNKNRHLMNNSGGHLPHQFSDGDSFFG